MSTGKTDTLTITGIPKEHVPLVWDQVEPLIEKALENGRGELWASDVLALLLSGDMQLWAAFEGSRVKAVCTSEIVTYPRLKICRLAHCAGDDMADWLPFLSTIKAWAKTHGCQEIWGGGRKGWSRKLGWEPIYYICAEKCDVER